MTVGSELESAVAELWGSTTTRPPDLYRWPAFVRLRETCQSLYPEAGSRAMLDYALSRVLWAAGFPEDPIPPEAASREIDRTFTRKDGLKTHLCPLDLADELPPLVFGNAEVRTFTAAELSAMVGAAGRPVAKAFEAARFSQFNWLVVREPVTLDPDPGARAIPELLQGLGRDFASIEPHKRRTPEALEAALFALLLIPWEDLVAYKDLDWRGFRVPWVYTVDDDLFARPPIAPRSDTLSWEPRIETHSDGEEVEYEVPVVLPLESGADGVIARLDDAAWRKVEAARASTLFAGPAAHFLVRALLLDDIDEYLAHVTAIEAALGARSDYRDRAKLPDGRSGPTNRVAYRVGKLLGEPAAADAYREVFDRRSEFLHGRAMDPIPGTLRMTARRLARRVLEALVERAAALPPDTDRDGFLQDLLAP